jgi:hypothetical protein
MSSKKIKNKAYVLLPKTLLLNKLETNLVNYSNLITYPSSSAVSM